MDFNQAAALLGQSVAQNNEWSAQQAANQMAFQREMSNTAHQREIADLKAAGLNPVLSAKLGGASTPAGAMGSGDTSGTSALLELLMQSMETANAAASAASSAASAVQDNAAANLGIVGNGKIPMYEDDEAKGGNRVPSLNGLIGPDNQWHLSKDGKTTLSKLASALKVGAALLPGGLSKAASAYIGLALTPQFLEAGVNGLTSARRAASYKAQQEAVSKFYLTGF